MKPGYRRAAAALLVISILFSLTACKKTKKTFSKVVKEDDPYFDVQEIELKPRLNTDDYTCDLHDATIIGDYIVTNGNIFQRNLTSDEIVSPFFQNFVAVFDCNGEMISMVPNDLNTEVENILCGANNEIMILYCDYAPTANGIDELNEVSRHLCEITPTGEVVRDIPLMLDDMKTWSIGFGFMEDGNILVKGIDMLYCINKSGEILWSTECINQDFTSYDNGLYYDGKEWYIGGLSFDSDYEISECFFQKIDIQNQTISKEHIPNTDVFSERIHLSDGYYSKDMSGLYRVDLLSDKKEEVISWNSIDYNYLKFSDNAIKVISDNEIYACVSENVELPNESYFEKNYYGQIKLVKMTRAAKNPHAGKALITIGLFENSYQSFFDYIVRYNTVPDGLARIAIRFYDNHYMDVMYKGEKNSVSTIDQVYNEMLSGTGPDILMDFSEYGRFNSDKILLDLNSFIDGENGLNRSEYFNNVFRAFEVKGKMYQIPVCIDIAGYVANGDLIGTRTGWTCSEFDQVVGKLPESVEVFEYTTHENLLSIIVSNSMNSFIDYEKKEVFFDGEEFKQVLEIAKKYGCDNDSGGESFMPDLSGDHPADETERKKIEDGKLALVSTYIYNLTQFIVNRRLCNQKAIFVGYPSEDGSGMSARARMTFGISAYSDYSKEAWDFIRFMFNDEEQVTHSQFFSSIPLSRTAFEKCIDDEIKSNLQLKKFLEEVNLEIPEMVMVEYTEEDKTAYRKLVENVSTIYLTDLEIMSVIMEESKAYFYDDKDIEDVVTKIQTSATNIVQGRDKG
ncbi:MAG: extracellular solute-binding protein [Clostridiales bacterium]|nr:extracellular solute-binding protein [Clostridiales bacterium]